MAQSKMTTDMAYSKVEETVRGLISEKIMMKSQTEKLQSDLMARDREAQENSNLLAQLQSEKEQLIQGKQEGERQLQRLATTVQLNIQKHEILKATFDRLKRTSEALQKSVKEGEVWKQTTSKNLTDIIEALDRDRNKKSEELEKCQINLKKVYEQIESMKQQYGRDLQESTFKMEKLQKARKDLEEKLEVSESSRASFDVKVAALTDDLAGSHATTKALREEIRLLNTKLEESSKACQLLAQEIKSLEAQKTASCQLVEILKQDLNRKEADTTELATANEKLKLDVEDKISTLQEVRQAMVAKEKEHLQAMDSLQEALAKSQKTNVTLQMETEKLQQQLSQLTLKESSLMASLESNEASLKNAEEEIASLTGTVSKLNLETTNLQTILNGNNEQIRKLEDENIALEEAKDRLEAAVNDHKVNVKTLEEASTAKDEIISRLTDQLKEANGMLEDLMGQKGKLEEALIEKSSLIAKLEEDWKLKEASFQEILATMKTESEGDLGTLNATVAELQYKLQEKEALLTSLQEEVNSLKSTQIDLLSKQAQDSTEIQQREAAIENLNSRIQDEEKKRVELENQLTESSKSKDEALAQLQQSYEDAGELQKNLKSAHAEILDLTEQLKDVRSASEQKLEELQANVAEDLELKACEMQALNAQVVEANSKVATLDKELSSLRKSITQSSRAFENERQSWTETHSRFEQKVHALEEQIEKHIEMGQQSRAEVEKLSSKVKNLEVQNRRLTTDLENMTGELSTARAAVELKARECESLNQEQAKLWNEIQQKSVKIRELENEKKELETDIDFFMKLDDKPPTSTKGTKAAAAKGESTKKTTTATRGKAGAATKAARPQLKSYSRISNSSKPLEPKDDVRPVIAPGSYAPSPIWTSTPETAAEPIKPLRELLGGDVSFSSLFADSSPPLKDLLKGKSDEEKKAAGRRFYGGRKY